RPRRLPAPRGCWGPLGAPRAPAPPRQDSVAHDFDARAGTGPRAREARQLQAERRAGRRGTHRAASVVRLRDRVDDRQAESDAAVATAGRIDSPEAIEDALERVLRDPGPRVRHLDLERAAHGPRA